jgi:hypothetical protein
MGEEMLDNTDRQVCNQPMVTSKRDDVVRDEPLASGIAATEAHLAAEITYRQLDHWARQGWVRPSISSGEGRWAKRLYAPDDVVRLSLLRHLALSRVNASVVGPLVASLEIPAGDIRVVWGPVGAKQPDEPVLVVVGADEALSYLARPGAFVLYDPAGTRTRLAVLEHSKVDVGAEAARQPARRSA